MYHVREAFHQCVQPKMLKFQSEVKVFSLLGIMDHLQIKKVVERKDFCLPTVMGNLFCYQFGARVSIRNNSIKLDNKVRQISFQTHMHPLIKN